MRGVIKLLVHVVWSTKYRRDLLAGCDERLSKVITDACRSICCAPVTIGNADDHVHLLIELATNVALSTLVQRAKGRSSRTLGVPWQRRYFAESVSPPDADPLARYIRDQRRHHDDSHPAEMWQFHQHE